MTSTGGRAVFQTPISGDGRRRDIFPLPTLRSPGAVSGRVCRAVKRRIQCKDAEVRRVNMALTALNSLFLGGNKQMASSVVDSVQGLPLCQQDVIRSVIKRIQLLGGPPNRSLVCASGYFRILL